MSHLVPVEVAPPTRGSTTSPPGLLGHPLGRCLAAAFISSGLSRRPWAQTHVKAFIERQMKAYDLHPNSFPKELKVWNTKLRLSLIEKGTPLPLEEMGHLLGPLRACRNRRALMQFTRMGRALPKVAVSDSDRSEQIRRMTTPFDRPVPKPILNQLDLIPAPVLQSAAPTDLIGASACLEATRRDGGRTSLLKRDRPIPIPAGTMSSLSRTAVDPAVIGVQKNDDASLSHCEAVAVPELGAKVRMVTKHPHVTVANSHRGRRALWPLLVDKQHISTSESLNDPELSVLVFPKAKATDVVFSADLSAATDNLGWPVVRALCERTGIPFHWVCATSVSGTEVCRGTVMGLPVSWTFLSLIHYSICRAVDPNHRFRIKGDDLIALWSKEEIDHYVSLCESVGFVVNKSKSVVSHRWGTFCEVSYDRVKHNTLVRESDYSLRSFVKDEPLAPDQWLMVSRHGVSVKKLHRMAMIFHRHWIDLCNRFRVEPYAAPALGGLGLPPKRLDSKCSKRLQSLIRAANNGISLPVPDYGTGRLVQRYESAFATFQWSVNGSPELSEDWMRKHAFVIGRAAFVDATRGTYKSPTEKRYRRVRRLASFTRKYQKVAPAPFESTYRTMYDVLSRLNIVDSEGSRLRALGSSLSFVLGGGGCFAGGRRA